MNNKRIPGFQWAMIVFLFFIIAYVLPIILKDFQGSLPYKSFVFDITAIAPFIGALFCLLIFKHKRLQLGGLKFTIGLKTIERILLALILPLTILAVAMVSFNILADSFILLQAEDFSVSLTTVIIGQLITAMLIEFGFRSYLQNIVENRIYTFFASILVGIIYSIWNLNLSFGMTFAAYNFLYTFAFSMIIGELIRGTKGRTIYIATLFHFVMSFGLVFLFNEELGNVFAMKVIALSTVAVGVVYLLITMIIRVILYFFTKRNLDEIEENNYMDHLDDESHLDVNDTPAETEQATNDYEPASADTSSTVHDEQDEMNSTHQENDDTSSTVATASQDNNIAKNVANDTETTSHQLHQSEEIEPSLNEDESQTSTDDEPTNDNTETQNQRSSFFLKSKRRNRR
ncbi:CPBP family intramembrane metalloprotease [Staphylococcus arlettae]|uniref:CPBP family intramembrane glutamic endopeptidase n=1 Tax=Staphylococcus arlettae TaxID=29378 RepID=UPI000D1ADEB2|nr:CPBP family intramembrane glutamic endopeptidase [Staphylococcus arlettae]PTH28192.1 CPBP family intramembrane metalloprotease domain-containing protein [Staphylococcus arlettae]PTH47359.1 CPBP family intramembrane metalloprotease domain-containing protein [Staphylococcus arlettae]PTH54779.1 CPBP family intramembrane metalloprotease domain-containing protein [Staphylococcus arlettae]PTH56080.1 CPBP family intramembrane metalloprotease domain-containing protein [Staphylococcus arlettae]PTH64